MSNSILATLVLKAAGLAPQRIITSRGRLDFHYRRGVGHVREYTDLAVFHAEEASIRALPIPYNVRTLFGDVDSLAAAKAALAAIVKEDTGNREEKHASLCGLRETIGGEIARLEALGVGRKEAPPDGEPAPLPLSAREVAIEDRKAFLRRAGEEHTRSVARDHGLKITLLNNWPGMVNAIVDREFPPEGEGAAAALRSGGFPPRALERKARSDGARMR